MDLGYSEKTAYDRIDDELRIQRKEKSHKYT